MGPRDERAARYVSRAAKVTALAVGMRDKTCRETMLHIAADYHDLAESVAAIRVSKRLLQRSRSPNI
jgi:hypothetical protein